MTDLPEMLRIGREICGDLQASERREWWLSNGLGGYAAGTLALSLTRRYHGLLVAPLDPPLGRYLLCAKADATLLAGGREWPLFTNRWHGDAVAPAGYRQIESFRLAGRMPVWQFASGAMRLEQRIWMEYGQNTSYVAWRLLTPPAQPDMHLRVSLLVSARDHHSVSRSGEIAPSYEVAPGQLRIRHRDWFDLYARTGSGEFAPQATWIENFYLPRERERGLEDHDNHLCVAQVSLRLSSTAWSGLTISLDPLADTALEAALERAIARDCLLLEQTRAACPAMRAAPPWIQQCVLAADSFLFARPLPTRPDGRSVIAGYPWFGDWGRDTMIALPGLALATGRLETALDLLETFATYVDRGMLPNVFPGDGTCPEYNTVDAALWFVEAWRAYLEVSDDLAAVARVFPVLRGIIDAYRVGTRYGIHMDAQDGLIFAGQDGVQLTWMDAKVGDWVVTPRRGKPVEINALWYNALRSMAEFATRLGLDTEPYRDLANQTAVGFQRYVRTDGRGLVDLLDGPDGQDLRIRPNQLFAVSLPYSPLVAEDQARVVEICGSELLTSYGLRSLAPDDPAYCGSYRGDVWERDGAYHQGTVWAWLLGHFAIADYRVSGDRERALAWLAPLADHLGDAGLGSVSEIFDGDPPHHPRGAPLQAWSVACALEAYWRIAQ